MPNNDERVGLTAVGSSPLARLNWQGRGDQEKRQTCRNMVVLALVVVVMVPKVYCTVLVLFWLNDVTQPPVLMKQFVAVG